MVAILLVAGYHVWADRVSGGVDVFLMLSGFFVGGGLWRRFSRDGDLPLRPYLARHARRLLPASVTVLIATAVAVVVVLPVTRWGTGAEQTLASLLYAENWWLVSSGQTYGAADPDMSPWQHFWSLSVQGQLFVAVPLVLLGVWWLTRRLPRTRRLQALAATVGVTALASFVTALVMTRVDQPTAYFHTGARAWEFLVGMLLAMVLGVWRPQGRWWALLGWAGLGLLVATGLVVDGGAVFPGVATLLPIGAAAAVVLAGAAAPGSLLARGLGWGPLANAGRYAYGFYLWHWPILVLAVAVRGRGVGWLAGTAVLLLAGLLAVLTYHLVEAPLRERRSVRDSLPSRVREWVDHRGGPGRRVAEVRPHAPRRQAVVAVALVLVVGAPLGWLGRLEILRAQTADQVAFADLDLYPGALAITEPELFGDFPDRPFIPAVEAIPDTTVFSDGCVTLDGQTELRHCAYADDADAPTIALVGGSHSEQWFAALDTVARNLSFRLVPYLKVGCPFMDPAEAPSQECALWLENVFDELLETSPEFVVTTSTRPLGDGNDYVPASYVAAFERIPSSSHIVAIRDTPWFDFSMSDCVAERAVTWECDVPLYDRIALDDPTLALTIPGVDFVDMNDVICPDDLCSAVQGNRLVFSDDNHMTSVYTETLAPELEKRLAIAMQGRTG